MTEKLVAAQHMLSAIKRPFLRIWYELYPLWKPLGKLILTLIVMQVSGGIIVFVIERYWGICLIVIGIFTVIERIYFFTRDKETRDRESRRNIRIFAYLSVCIAIIILIHYT